MRRIVLLFLLATSIPFLLSSCKTNQEETQQEENDTSAAVPAISSVKKVGNIPVYENFADLEPLFHKQTDTTYVINFWATWCKPCVEELPYFEKLYNNHQSEKVKIVLVSLDFPKQLETKLIPFVEEHKLKSDVVALTDIDFNTWIDKVSPEWSGAIPVTVVYNAAERKFISEQFANYEELDAIVQSLL